MVFLIPGRYFRKRVDSKKNVKWERTSVIMKLLKDIAYDLSMCVHCGVCKSKCPTCRVEQREWGSARGKLSLCDAKKKGEIEISPKFVKAISECFTCGLCKASCPNYIDIPSNIQSVRIEIVEYKGLSFHQ